MPPPSGDWGSDSTSGSVESKLAESRQALLAKSIDYAAMFPPVQSCTPR